MTQKPIPQKRKMSIAEQMPEYAHWLRTVQHTGPSMLSWYISPILKMQTAGITDEDICSVADIDLLLIRACHVQSIWDIGTSKRRTYLRNIIRMYRSYLQRRENDAEKETHDSVRTQ